MSACKAMLYFCLMCCCPTSYAQQAFSGQWYQVPADWTDAIPLNKTIDTPSLTGGQFVFKSTFTIDHDDEWVIDFKNASVIGLFQHTIHDSHGNVVFSAEGGIESDADNPFFMRHGRYLQLPPGRYQLTTLLKSKYLIAQPAPYLDSLSHYRQAIKLGNFIGLVSMGVLLSLGIYYAIFAYMRKRQTEVMYTLFILFNVMFNGTSMLITPDILNLHWFYLAGAPILFSNFAYVLFAKGLLQIRANTHPILNKLAHFALMILTGLLLVALVNHHLILECARIGVAVMMSYALIAAIARARHGYTVAYYYLIAIFTFFVIGSIAISSQDLEGIYTIYVEHIGLMAVTAEVLLIGLVLGYQFSEIYREKEQHLAMVEHSLHIAHHDSLTGLPNRYAFDIALETLPDNGILIVLDMDNLKLYNDQYGHQKGDEMLQMFAAVISHSLGKNALIHRLGGDEFAITCDHQYEEKRLKQAITNTVTYMHAHGFEKAGVSFGIAYRSERPYIDEFHALADERMYQHKRQNKA